MEKTDLKHQPVEIRRGVVPRSGVIGVDLEGDRRSVVAGSIDVVLARGQDRSLTFDGLSSLAQGCEAHCRSQSVCGKHWGHHCGMRCEVKRQDLSLLGVGESHKLYIHELTVAVIPCRKRGWMHYAYLEGEGSDGAHAEKSLTEAA